MFWLPGVCCQDAYISWLLTYLFGTVSPGLSERLPPGLKSSVSPLSKTSPSLLLCAFFFFSRHFLCLTALCMKLHVYYYCFMNFLLSLSLSCSPVPPHGSWFASFLPLSPSVHIILKIFISVAADAMLCLLLTRTLWILLLPYIPFTFMNLVGQDVVLCPSRFFWLF